MAGSLYQQVQNQFACFNAICIISAHITEDADNGDLFDSHELAIVIVQAQIDPPKCPCSYQFATIPVKRRLRRLPPL